jgi:16S rRNA (uracil1498-N3)-methyltransferase
MPRFYVEGLLQPNAAFNLPPGPARHAQVLRLQPESHITLFDGHGGEWSAVITHMGRSDVAVQLTAHHDLLEVQGRELPLHVTLALGMPANERMDSVIEKATELGAAAIQPLMCERSVLRLTPERAAKKVAHWQAVAVAAAEQSGRTRVPHIAPVCHLADWLGDLPAADTAASEARWVLSFAADAQPLAHAAAHLQNTVCLSGPEGGLTCAEERAARGAGFIGVSLGPRVLRADTAPLAVMSHVSFAAHRSVK